MTLDIFVGQDGILRPIAKSALLALATCLLPHFLTAATFQTHNADAKPWAAILGSVGIVQDSQRDPEIIVAGQDAPKEVVALAQNKILIVEGAGPAAAELGIIAKPEAALRPPDRRRSCSRHADHLGTAGTSAARPVARRLPGIRERKVESCAAAGWKTHRARRYPLAGHNSRRSPASSGSLISCKH